MNQEQIRLLSKIKKLVYEGKRKFIIRKDRDYLEELLEIGISEEVAWEEILYLKPMFYFQDPKPCYRTDGKSLIFKKEINGIVAYIKLRIEKEEKEEIVACLSFHKDVLEEEK